jgi:DNA-binding IclR family transcriptional regulator
MPEAGAIGFEDTGGDAGLTTSNRASFLAKEFRVSGELPRQGIDAVEVAGAILQALLRCPRPARLKDIEIASGIPSAKLHRYLVSMIRCGLVRRHESSGRYDFGLLAHQVGQVAARDNDVVSQIEARLAQFSRQVGEVIGVAQWVGNGVTFVNWFESSPEFSIRLKPGLQLGVTTSATAKLLAAYLEREVTEPLVKSDLAERQVDAAGQVERVYKEYAEIRGRGIAHSLGARRSGLNALSVPVFDREGRVVVAVTALGMAPRFDADMAGPLASQRLALSRELSAQMGGPRPGEVAERPVARRK